jgi:phage-related protein (TIGR01555 family)
MNNKEKRLNGSAAAPVVDHKGKSKMSVRINRWVNALTGQGTIADSSRFGFYSAGVVALDDQTLEALYANNDFAKTIVDRIVEDSLRNEPVFLLLNPGETTEEAMRTGENIVGTDLVQKWNLIQKVTKAAVWGRLYGCGGVVLGVNDGKKMSEELVLPISQGQLQWLEVIDKQNILPLEFYTELDIAKGTDKSKLGNPKTYSIQPSNVYAWTNKDMLVVHETRMLMFGGARTSNRIRATNNFCDLSVLQDKYDLLREIGNTEHAVHNLIQGASQAVYKVKGLMDQVSSDENRILELMRIVDYSRSTGKAIILDADGEEFEQVGAENISGLPQLQEMSYKRLAAAARMPLTILMGQSPSGLNATGESDSRHWFNQVESYQKEILAERMVKLMEIILQSEGISQENKKLNIYFPSLWEATDLEKAQLMQTKATTAKILIDSGVLTPEEIKKWFV